MNMLFLIFILIAVFCGVSIFCMGVDLGKELQKKEQEKQDKILKEIRNKGYNVNV